MTHTQTPAPPALQPSPHRRRSSTAGRRGRIPWLLAGPGLLFVAVLLVYPALEAIASGAFRQAGRGYYDRDFVGLDNFSQLLADTQVMATFWRTALWVAAVTVLSYGIGLGVALMLHRQFRGRTLVRSLVLVPWAVPFIAAAFAWQNIYDGRYGILNYTLTTLGLVDAPVQWLGRPSTALGSVIVVAIWKQVPFVAVTLLAGLQSIGSDYYEAAELDGAGATAQFRYVTWPGIAGVSTIVVGFTTIWTYNQFDLIFLMTGGGPAGSSQIISVFTYMSAFAFGNTNYAAAIGTFGLLILALLIVPFARLVTGRSVA